MADDGDDRDGKTEAPSPRRLQQARDEGQVPVGHDAIVVAGLAAAALTTVALAGTLRDGLAALIAQTAAGLDRTPFSSLPALAARPALAAVAICGAAALAAAIAGFAQTGGGFWPHLAGPDVSRLFQASRLGRLASKDFLLDLLLAAGKVAAVGGAVWMGAEGEVRRLPALVQAQPGDQLAFAFHLLAAAARPALAAALGLAAAEWALTRWRFMDRLKMTKEELKRELKEDEGDPLIRGQRRRRHRDLLKNQAKLEVPRADALVVNPTHVAVAIRYRKDEGRAPRVTAKGKGALAEYMRNLARENGVPIYQDIPLARLLYRKVKVGREIPSQTYKAVAAVLAFVYRLTGKRGGARA